MAAAGKPNLAGRVAFTYPAFVLYQVARFCIVLATEMQAVAIGWQVYEITKRPLDLGLVGLSQFLPGILLFLVSGYTADRFDRRKVLTVGYAGFAICSALLLAISIRGAHTVYPIYAVSALVGVVRSFNAPVSRAILPLLVPEEHFHSAFAWGATIFQTATILGPAAGGLIYAIFRGPAAVYAGVPEPLTAGDVADTVAECSLTIERQCPSSTLVESERQTGLAQAAVEQELLEFRGRWLLGRVDRHQRGIEL